MPGGYVGKILNVDLATGALKDEPLPEALLRDYLGGYGLGARLLYERIPAGADPLGPQNVLGFLTGPLTGTGALIGSRFVVVGKSPKTHTWGDANCGGHFGPHLKYAGYDGVLVSGISPRPVYLLIEDGRPSLHDAAGVWGKNTAEAEAALKRIHGQEAQVALIGTAGEKVSLLACVMNDEGRAAGRSGLGAVMGAKRLKAIVVKGSQVVPVANESRLKEIHQKALSETKGGFFDTLRNYGTAGITADSAASGDSPVKNWGGSGVADFPPERAEHISDDGVIAYQVRKYACHRCPIACGGTMSLAQGPFALALPHGHKPEYETLASFGTMILNDNIESIIKANELCNEYGLDTISAGCTVAFAVECYEQGVISQKDTGGLELKWGNAAAIVELTRQIGAREGFGAVLADGMKVAVERIGPAAAPYAVHVEGEEVPMHDPRFLPDLATAYILDATPARHTQGSELVKPPDLRWPAPNKYDYGDPRIAEGHRLAVNINHITNASGVCMFGVSTFGYQVLFAQVRAVTGWDDLSDDDLLRMGERIATIRHAFNLREGRNPLRRQFAGRLVGRPPLATGPLQGVTVDYAAQIRNYLRLIGWDEATTVPGPAALKALGLEFLAADLAKANVPKAE